MYYYYCQKGADQIPWPQPCLPKLGDLLLLSREDRAPHRMQSRRVISMDDQTYSEMRTVHLTAGILRIHVTCCRHYCWSAVCEERKGTNWTPIPELGVGSFHTGS
jgi:hypothetical protein